ncbi:MAG: hypothetical protein JJU45_08035 [Acidimicrobiia bacterium]|nr:hypothetical protein [Acidimicrobiia bacterium]
MSDRSQRREERRQGRAKRREERRKLREERWEERRLERLDRDNRRRWLRLWNQYCRLRPGVEVFVSRDSYGNDVRRYGTVQEVGPFHVVGDSWLTYYVDSWVTVRVSDPVQGDWDVHTRVCSLRLGGPPPPPSPPRPRRRSGTSWGGDWDFYQRYGNG